MKQDLLFFLGQAGVSDAAMLLTMNGDVSWRGGALSAQCGLRWSSGSRHSMSSTCGPRTIISLVTSRIGGGVTKPIRFCSEGITPFYAAQQTIFLPDHGSLFWAMKYLQ
jgi:hypothetical protein